MTAPTLIFDLDGTLADSNRDLVPALNRTIETVGLEPLSTEEVGYTVGRGIRAMLTRAFELRGAALDDPLIERLFDVYIADYSENLCVDTVLYDGVVEALEDFGRNGWLMGVCTNKFELMAVKLIEQLGVDGHFSVIAGSDTYEARKPHPIHLIKTIESAGGDPRNAIMVGDSISDIAAAKAANVPVVAVDFGYTDVPVRELDPDIVISHYDELKDAVASLR